MTEFPGCSLFPWRSCVPAPTSAMPTNRVGHKNIFLTASRHRSRKRRGTCSNLSRQNTLVTCDRCSTIALGLQNIPRMGVRTSELPGDYSMPDSCGFSAVYSKKFEWSQFFENILNWKYYFIFTRIDINMYIYIKRDREIYMYSTSIKKFSKNTIPTYKPVSSAAKTII